MKRSEDLSLALDLLSVESQTDDIESLVPAAVAGEPRARERLMAHIRPLVLRYCRRRLESVESVIGYADDVAQDVCVAVVSALPHYEIKGRSFRAFVYGIAAHKVTDAFRSVARNQGEPVAKAPEAQVLYDGPDQRVLLAELTERLGELLHRLTARQREVLVLRVVVGLSAEETAQAIGTTPGAVRITQHRALCRLRGVWEADTETAGAAGGDASDEIPLKAMVHDGDVDLRLQRGHQAFVDVVGRNLDLDGGLTQLLTSNSHQGYVSNLASRLNLDVGLEELLREEDGSPELGDQLPRAGRDGPSIS